MPSSIADSRLVKERGIFLHVRAALDALWEPALALPSPVTKEEDSIAATNVTFEGEAEDDDGEWEDVEPID